MTNSNRRKAKSKRGQGRLYKRGKDGREYAADSKVQGVYYLEYRVDGKRVRQRLTDSDGMPITSIRKAREEQGRLTSPFIAGGRVEQLRAVKAKLEAVEDQYTEAYDEANPPLSVRDGWKAYKASSDRPDSGPRTLNDYKGHWKRFERWLSDNEPFRVYLRDVSPQITRDYVGTLQKFSSNTFNKHLSFLRLAFDVLQEPARITTNPFEKVKSKRLQTESRRALTIEELRQILTEARGDFEILLALGTFTGLRLGDCCTLKWGEVDLVAGVIRRIPNKTRTRKPKPVVVGIPPMLAGMLQEIPKKSRKGHVLPALANQYSKDPASITKVIQAHLEACGIQTHKGGTGAGTGKRAVVEVGFHSLRHSYVSLHAERGTPQAIVQAVVGHGSPAMTQHYTHISEGKAKEIAGVIDIAGYTETESTKKELPDWVREKLEGMTDANWKGVRREMLAHPPI